MRFKDQPFSVNSLASQSSSSGWVGRWPCRPTPSAPPGHSAEAPPPSPRAPSGSFAQDLSEKELLQLFLAQRDAYKAECEAWRTHHHECLHNWAVEIRRAVAAVDEAGDLR